MSTQDIMNELVDNAKRIIELKDRLREAEAERDELQDGLEKTIAALELVLQNPDEQMPRIMARAVLSKYPKP